MNNLEINHVEIVYNSNKISPGTDQTEPEMNKPEFFQDLFSGYQQTAPECQSVKSPIIPRVSTKDRPSSPSLLAIK